MEIVKAVLEPSKEYFLIIHIPNGEVKNAYIITENGPAINKVFNSVEDAFLYIKTYNRIKKDSLVNYNILQLKET